MKMTRALALLLLLPLAACGGTKQTLPDLGVDEDQGEADGGSCPLSLAAITSQAVTVTAETSVDLTVRLSDCRDQALTGRPVAFLMSGASQNAALSSYSASTDGSGLATVKLTAGTQATTFKVEASHSALAPVVFDITVTLKPAGTITVEMSYGGAQNLTSLQPVLLPDQACAALDAYNLPAAVPQVAPLAPVPSIIVKPQFTGVPVGTYAVVVTGSTGGELAAFGCTSAVVVETGKTTVAPVTLTDLPIDFAGTFRLDNQFDLTGALPPSVANTVKLFDEATDDHDLTNEGNSHGNNQYGLDPGAFLLDFILRQICRWECKTGEDFDSCSQINHPQGDISALYLKSFGSWSNAKPYFWGLCGALDVPYGTGYVYTWLNQQIQTGITSVVPTVVQNLLQIVGDLSAAFTKMKVRSRLTLGPGSHTGPNFTHVLETMTISVHNLSGGVQIKEFQLAAAGLTNLSYSGMASASGASLVIPKHTFQLSFGKLIQYIYLTLVLPALGYTSTGQMFQSWVNCTSVGTWISQQIPLISAAQGKSFCDAGLMAAGAWVEQSITKVTSAATQLEIEGTCQAGLPLGPKRLALTLTGGSWTGTITEGTFTAPLKGTFTGTRQ